MKTYEGNVEITTQNQKKWENKLKYVEKITGYLHISSSVTLPKLTSVGGDISFYSSVTLEAPKLTSVGGYLYISSSVTLEAPKLTSVGGYLYIYSSVTLPKLTSVGGYLYIYSSVTLPKLTSVGGYLSIYSKISLSLEKRLWSRNKKNKWYVNNLASEWLLKRLETKKETEYYLNNVTFKKEWFDKIRKDQLTAEEVFAIDNIEHRRVAFEFMDKAKMKQLKNYKILDEKIDEKGNPMKILSFTVQNMREPLKFYNCICPSSKREYFVGTDKDTCVEAKAGCWGLKAEEIEFVEEW
jgi:hypothetical protein